MTNWMTAVALAAALGSASIGAQAASWGDSLRQQASSLGTPSPASGAGNSVLGGVLGGSGGSSAVLSSLGVPAAGTASNAAGVITYCVKNNYINANKAKAEQVKDQLLGKIGMDSKKKQEPKDQGYLDGLAGKISGSNGQSFSMDKLKGDMKEKACDFVLDNATSLL